MSYELCLTPPVQSRFSSETFQNYFTGLDNYDVDGQVASYKNETTGVSFYFVLLEEEDGTHYVNFHINFMRPSFFILEAEPEVSKFVETYNCSVEGGYFKGEGYDKNAFLACWYITTERACKSVLEDGGEFFNYDQETLLKHWKWNNNKEEMQFAIGEEVFVPTIKYYMIDGEIFSGIVWPDAIPILMPKVDIFIIMRFSLYSEGETPAEMAPIMCTWSDLASEIENFPTLENFDGYHMGYDEPPAALVDKIKALPGLSHPGGAVPVEQIMDSAFALQGATTDTPQKSTPEQSSVENNTPQTPIPQKGRGQSYRVTMQDGMNGEFCKDPGTQRNVGFHVPQWGNSCICCNDETSDGIFVYPQKTEGVPPTEFAVPLCDHCAPNTGLDSKGFLALGNLAIVSLVLIFGYFFINPRMGVLVSGIAGLLIAGIGGLIRKHRIKYGRSVKLSIGVFAPKVVIKTPNRALVERLERLNRDAITEIL